MVDKFTNVLMILIVVVIIVFGGIYYYKMQAPGDSYALKPDTDKVQDVNDVQQLVYSNSTANESESEIVIPSGTPNNSGTQNPLTSPQASSYAYNNKYYYNQLDQYAKVLYDAIANNLDKLKTGTCKINIDYDFSPILDNSDNEHSLKPYYDDAIDALNLDIPNLFYIDFSKLYLFVETRTTLFSKKYTVYLGVKENTNLYAENFHNEEQINDAIGKINAIKSNFINRAYQSDYAKIIAIHDWIIDNAEYSDEGVYKSNIYGIFIDKKAVCEGYARTFKYILDELNINNILVTGIATNSSGDSESHMWNYVSINGKWYAVDVTWDDPIIIGGGVLTNVAKHRYFLIGSNKFFENHFENHKMLSEGKEFRLPTLQIGNYQ